MTQAFTQQQTYQPQYQQGGQQWGVQAPPQQAPPQGPPAGYYGQPQQGPPQGYTQAPPQQGPMVPNWMAEAMRHVQQGTFPHLNTSKFIGQVAPTNSMPNGFEVKPTTNGTMKLVANIKVRKAYSDRSGQQKLQLLNIRMCVFGQRANEIASLLRVGTMVGFRGEYRVNSFPDRQQQGRWINLPEVVIDARDQEGFAVLGVLPYQDERQQRQQQFGGAPQQQGQQQYQQQGQQQYQPQQQWQPPAGQQPQQWQPPQQAAPQQQWQPPMQQPAQVPQQPAQAPQQPQQQWQPPQQPQQPQGGYMPQQQGGFAGQPQGGFVPPQQPAFAGVNTPPPASADDIPF